MEQGNSNIRKGIQDIKDKFGITFPHIGDGEAQGELILKETYRNFYGIPYGGYLFTLADSTAGAAFLSAGGYGVTVSGNIEFLRGAGPEAQKLICNAKVKKAGKTLYFVDAEVEDDTGALLTRCHFIFFNISMTG